MARLNKQSESPAPRISVDIYDASPPPRSQAGRQQSLSPSPAASNSSDKENRASRPLGSEKEPSVSMPPPRLSRGLSDASGGKRKRNDGRSTTIGREPRRRRTGELPVEDMEDREEAGSADEMATYDPDQDIEERRRLRQGLRDLDRELNDNRSEFLDPESTGLVDTLNRANEITSSIKQTTDATIDSRLLMSTAELAKRKIGMLALGKSSKGIDLDSFVTQARSFMRGVTSRRVHDEEDDVDDGDMLDWEYFGRHACMQYNCRPGLPGFLLGPLSLEKRIRKPMQRRGPLKTAREVETRPEILKAGDIERSDNKNLTFLCTKIRSRLASVAEDRMNAVENEVDDTMADEEVQQVMAKHDVNSTGGIDLIRFAINPYSFGQTVENIFYVSFLIRDGKAGLSVDERGMPFLEPTNPRTREEAAAKNVMKHQAILSIDMATWEELIKVWDIREPMIPHRAEEEAVELGPRGWYS